MSNKVDDKDVVLAVSASHILSTVRSLKLSTEAVQDVELEECLKSNDTSPVLAVSKSQISGVIEVMRYLNDALPEMSFGGGGVIHENKEIIFIDSLYPNLPNGYNRRCSVGFHLQQSPSKSDRRDWVWVTSNPDKDAKNRFIGGKTLTYVQASTKTLESIAGAVRELMNANTVIE
jgi:hypothetical protein